MENLDTKSLKRDLADVSKEIESVSGDNVATNAIVEKFVTNLLDSEFASLWIFDEAEALLRRERNDGTRNEISVLEQRGIIARSFLTMSGGIYNYLASEKEYVSEFDNPDSIRIKSKVIAPIIDNERFLGIVTAYSSVRHIRNFTEDDLALLQAVVPFLAGVIRKMRPQENADGIERVYIKENLHHKAEAVSEKVEQLQRERTVQEKPDAVLNFMANTVHDIRTPANSLYGFLDLLEERIHDERLLQYIRNAKESAHFINELTTSILDRISLQHEGKSSEALAINPIKFFSDIATTFTANMFDKKIAYTIYIDPMLPKEIRIDATKLKRVIMNLIGNAWKFTPKFKSIELSVVYDETKRLLHVAVSDTGIGIAKEKQQEIFEAFKQAEDDTALQYGGTGLGLAISAQYVAEMGGKLRLESALEKGSRFYFDIPVEPTDAAPRFGRLPKTLRRIDIIMDKSNQECARNIVRYLLRMGVAKEQVRAIASADNVDARTTHIICFQQKMQLRSLQRFRQSKLPVLIIEEGLFSLTGEEAVADFSVVSELAFYGNELYKLLSTEKAEKQVFKKVLIADDDRINIELIRAILEEEFCKVETAEDGYVAEELLKNAVREGEPYSIVFIDKHMPNVSGPEAIASFRAFEKSASAKPVYAVSITGDPIESDQERALFDHIMHKPFNKQAVKEVLSHVKR